MNTYISKGPATKVTSAESREFVQYYVVNSLAYLKTTRSIGGMRSMATYRSVISAIKDERFHRLPYAKETCEHFGIPCNGLSVKQYLFPDSE